VRLLVTNGELITPSGPLRADLLCADGVITGVLDTGTRVDADERYDAAGEAIARGLTVAIDEINAKGGLLGGRKIELVSRDDESNPAKGVIAARELIYKEKVAVIFGGLDTPVSMAIVPLVNQAKMPFMGPWAAGTGITKNAANPNYVFRVSAVDEIVDKAMPKDRGLGLIGATDFDRMMSSHDADLPRVLKKEDGLGYVS